MGEYQFHISFANTVEYWSHDCLFRLYIGLLKDCFCLRFIQDRKSEVHDWKEPKILQEKRRDLS